MSPVETSPGESAPAAQDRQHHPSLNSRPCPGPQLRYPTLSSRRPNWDFPAKAGPGHTPASQPGALPPAPPSEPVRVTGRVPPHLREGNAAPHGVDGEAAVQQLSRLVQEGSPQADEEARKGLRKGLLPPPLRVQRANAALTEELNEVTGAGVPEWPPRLTKGSLSESSSEVPLS